MVRPTPFADTSELAPEVIVATQRDATGPRLILARRKAWVSLLLVAGLAALAAETGLRLLNPPFYRYTHRYLSSHYYSYHGNIRLIPGRGSQFRIHRKDGSLLYDFFLNIDEYGTRTDGTPDQRDPTYLGQPRLNIHCIGDGLTLGWGISSRLTWPDQLQRRLGRTYHVINMGIDETGLITSARKSASLEHLFDSHMVIWAVGQNDFADDQRELNIRARSRAVHIMHRGFIKSERMSYIISSLRAWSIWRELSDTRAVSSIGFRPETIKEKTIPPVSQLPEPVPETATLGALVELKARLDEKNTRLHVVITDLGIESQTVLRFCKENDIPHSVAILGQEHRLPADFFLNERGSRQLAAHLYDTIFKTQLPYAAP